MERSSEKKRDTQNKRIEGRAKLSCTEDTGGGGFDLGASLSVARELKRAALMKR